MGVPQIIYIVLYMMGLGVIINSKFLDKGKPRIHHKFSHLLISAVLAWGLYIWGGFLNEIGIFQIMLMGWWAFGLGLTLALEGKPITYPFWYTCLSCLIPPTLLYLGGFFS
jgi:hypothetical protein